MAEAFDLRPLHEVDGGAAEAATRQTRAQTRRMRPGERDEEVEFRAAIVEVITRAFVALKHELAELREVARTHPACLGARLTGGGFGGSTINLVQRAHVDSFSKAIAAVYEKQTGRKLEPMICQAVDGAR